MASEKIKILEAVLELDWQCCLVGSSKMAPRIFIFLIVLGAEYSSYVKSIETHARAFLTLNILFKGTLHCDMVQPHRKY